METLVASGLAVEVKLLEKKLVKVAIWMTLAVLLHNLFI